MARPTKLTDELQSELCKLIQTGSYAEIAAAYVGIGESTFYDWMQRGDGTHPTRRSSRRFVEFAESVKRAEAAREVRNITIIAKAAQGDKDAKLKPEWQAAAWMLERTAGKRYGRNAGITHSGELNLNIQQLAAELVELAESDEAKEV